MKNYGGSRGRARAEIAIGICALTCILLRCGCGMAAVGPAFSVNGMSPEELYCLCLVPRARFVSRIRIWNPSIGDLVVKAAGYGGMVVYSLDFMDHESCLAVNDSTVACYRLPVKRVTTGVGNRATPVPSGEVMLVPCDDEHLKLILAMLVPVGEDLPLLKSNYNIEKSTGFYYHGKESVRISLLPKLAGNVERTAWVDGEHGVLLSLEDTNCRGEVIQRLQVIDIDYDPEFDAERAKRAEIALAMAVSKGGARQDVLLECLSQTLGFKAAVPSWTPPGYELVGARIIQKDACWKKHAWWAGGVAHLVYYDGLGVISLYETYVPWWASCKLEPEAGNVIEWEKNGIRYILIGDVDPELLLRMARSVS